MYVPFSSTILRPDYINLNLYFYTFSGLLFQVFLGIIFINAAVNMYFGGVLSGVGNSLNTVIMYLFLHTGTIFFKD